MTDTRFNTMLADPARWDAMIDLYEQQAEPFTGLFAADALAGLEITAATDVLDVATGTGAAALAAAARGARVVAIDFSAGMVGRVAAHARPNIIALQMDGQSLDLPDASFDMTLSIFGVMLFPDWRQGLREMARVTRPGGRTVVATWEAPAGAATNLLLDTVCATLFPDITPPAPPAGMAVLRTPEAFAAELIAAGFTAPVIERHTHDFGLRLDALDDADRLFAMQPLWAELSPDRRADAIRLIRALAAQAGETMVLPIPSTALIATAQR
ncbi:class I SAM-dependent methyltransferase [Sphingomonas sp.]|uniref:class I SAM-dependent methyltransferase n=1 Tax=Sphingomonas sp. TaxID=28214 RepID=UPI003D6CF2E5